MPTVIMKAAMTLDGQLAAADGTSQWITSEAARRDVHALRASVDAVMVGAGTVLADNPRLDVRLDDYTGPQPRPIVVAGERDLPPSATVFERNPVVFSPTPRSLPGQIVETQTGTAGGVDIAAALHHLDDLGIASVLVEGGATLLAAMWREGLIDRGVIYLGQKLAGGVGRPLFSDIWPTLSAARAVRYDDVATVGGDLRISFSFDA